MSPTVILLGVYLTSFDEKSIMVSEDCLREINRLRSAFRNDLPFYDLSEASTGKKRKLTGVASEIALPLPRDQIIISLCAKQGKRRL